MKFPIISKDQFCKYIDVLKKMDDKENLLTNTFQEIDENGEGEVNLIALYSNERDTIIELLNTAMEAPIDIHIGSDIEYFCYDLNFGKEYKNRQDWIQDENGHIIDLSTPEKLYDYLVQGYFERHPEEKI